MLEQQEPRTGLDHLKRKLLTTLIPNQRLMQTGVMLAKPLRGLLPASVSSQLPLTGKDLFRPANTHPRKMLLLEGCAQSGLTPETNAAAARVLNRFGIQLLPETRAGCCGALRLHTSEREKGLNDIKQRIDTWWPLVEAGVEAIISTASGCGVTVKDYGDLLKNDPEYAGKAMRVAELAGTQALQAIANLGIATSWGTTIDPETLCAVAFFVSLRDPESQAARVEFPARLVEVLLSTDNQHATSYPLQFARLIAKGTNNNANLGHQLREVFVAPENNRLFVARILLLPINGWSDFRLLNDASQRRYRMLRVLFTLGLIVEARTVSC